MSILREKRGMTLIEVLSVIAILSMLIIMVIPNVNKLFSSSKIDTATNDLRMANSAIQKFYTENPEGDITAEQLSDYLGYEVSELGVTQGNHKKFITKMKEDPWGVKYQFYINNIGTKYTIMHSYGPNKKNDVKTDQSLVGDDILFVYYPEE